MLSLVSFLLGYFWGKTVQRTGSWSAAGAATVRVVRELLSGLSRSTPQQ